MGQETKATIKGHGFAVGDVFKYYGKGTETPCVSGTQVILSKEGAVYALTVVGGKHDGTKLATFGAASPIWATPLVAVATDVPGEAEYVSREDFAAQVAEAKKPRAKSAAPKVTESNAVVELPSGQVVKLRPGVTAEQYLAAHAETAEAFDVMAQALDVLVTNSAEGGRPIASPAEVKIAEGDTVYRDRDGAQGVVSAITVNGELIIDFHSGAQVTTTVEELTRNCYEVISAVDMVKLREAAWQAELSAAKSGTFIDETASSVTLARRATEVQPAQSGQATVAVIDVAAREAFELSKIDAIEQMSDRAAHAPQFELCAEEAWHGTNTCLAHPDKVTKSRVTIKAPIRTCLGRRKRKAIKRARRQAQGMKGGK